MSHPQVSPATKSAWIAKLREPGLKQCFRTTSTPEGARCAMGPLCVDNIDPELYRRSCSIRLDNGWILFEKITEMNDMERKTLPQIADWIEANL